MTNLTKELIPTNGTKITETYYPAGFLVAKYDDAGLATAPRYFPTMEAAKSYAASL